MKGKSNTTLIISAVGFIAALLVDLYLIISMSSQVGLIISISLIVLIDTYFMVDGILYKVDSIVNNNIDKQNELNKIEKGIYSVAKREETSRTQSMSAMLDVIMELKEENSNLINQLIEQEKISSKMDVKKSDDNTTKVVNSNERVAVLIAQMATANAKSQTEAIEILNDICKELESRSSVTSNTYDHYAS